MYDLRPWTCECGSIFTYEFGVGTKPRLHSVDRRPGCTCVAQPPVEKPEPPRKPVKAGS